MTIKTKQLKKVANQIRQILASTLRNNRQMLQTAVKTRAEVALFESETALKYLAEQRPAERRVISLATTILALVFIVLQLRLHSYRTATYAVLYVNGLTLRSLFLLIFSETFIYSLVIGVVGSFFGRWLISDRLVVYVMPEVFYQFLPRVIFVAAAVGVLSAGVFIKVQTSRKKLLAYLAAG